METLPTDMDLAQTTRSILHSGVFDAEWYSQTYPDVPLSGMDPVEHYLIYGTAMGRNPGPEFDTRFYLTAYPEVAEAGLNPVLHYAMVGQAREYMRKPPFYRDPDATALPQTIGFLRAALYGLGLTQEPLEDLRGLARSGRLPAARVAARVELAVWHFLCGTDQDYRLALEHVRLARADGPGFDTRCMLRVIELLCLSSLQDRPGAAAVFDAATQAGEISANVLLAWVNHQPDAGSRCDWINQALARYDIPPIALLDDTSLPAYDRLTSAVPLPAVTEGPTVSVLLAAYKSEGPLATALRALQDQTWKNLEILVIDDCSPDNGATCAVVERFAASDPRIRLVRMATNGGAYIARNRGLDLAIGDFVTIHDADDWSHPKKIETQVRFLMDTPEVMGCTSEQARVQEDLTFPRIRGSGQFIVYNTSSFLFRRAPMRKALGYWDTVRFGADNEFIRRMQAVFGPDSFVKLPTGPLSFQRDALSSVTRDTVMGLGGAYYGVRREYHDAQLFHHGHADTLKYTGDPSARPFPVSPMMRPDRAERLATPRWVDVVAYGDFRVIRPGITAFLDDLDRYLAAGKTVALVQTYVYRAVAPPAHLIHWEFRRRLDGESLSILVYGDHVQAGKILHVTEGCSDSRFLPVVQGPMPPLPG